MTSQPRSEADANRSPFAEGDVAVLYDRRRRRYRVPLRLGGSFSSHLGAINHDDVIGRHEGFVAITSKGHRVVVLRPTFQERVLDLPRQSQVIYPKDLGSLLMRCDLYPGARVIEVGLGSGAAAAVILRAIGPEGTLVSYEAREQVVGPAQRNIEELAPGAANHQIVVGDAHEAELGNLEADRMLTDVPEPWRLTNDAADALRTGGVLACFLPTVIQIHQLTMALTMDLRWRLVETVEIMERGWHVADQSVRPEHRMVGHTGFITTARRCEPAPESDADPAADGDDESEAEAGEP